LRPKRLQLPSSSTIHAHGYLTVPIGREPLSVILQLNMKLKIWQIENLKVIPYPHKPRWRTYARKVNKESAG
jgi:hypothetical protein